MRWTRSVVVVLGIAACNGKDAGDTQDSDTPGGGTTPTYELLSEADVIGAEADLPQDVVDAQRVIMTLLAAATLVVAEPQVQDTLGAPFEDATFCWDPGPALTSYTIDYGNCGAIATTGAVKVNEHPQGAIGFELLGLTIEERVLGGTLGLDGTGAEPLSFVTYDTVASSPLPTTRSPIGVTIDGVSFSITWDGGLALDPDADQVLLWGVGQVQDSDGTTIVRIGGADESALTGSTAPAGAMASDLSYVDCRCPSSGESAYAVDVALGEISVDLDALQSTDDGVDDPVLDIAVDHVLGGEAVITATGCGDNQLALTLETTDIVLSVDGQTVAAEIQKKCDALVIEDEAKCSAFTNIASSIETFTFRVDPAIVQTATENDVATRFDGVWCRF